MTGEFKLSASGVNVCTSCSLPCSAVIVNRKDIGFVLLPSMWYLCSELRNQGLGRLFEVTGPFQIYFLLPVEVPIGKAVQTWTVRLMSP